MIKSMAAAGICLLAILTLTACKKEEEGITETKEEKGITETKEEKGITEKIDAKQAKEMMDSDDDIIILDVRTEEEYVEGHIKSAVLLSDTEVADRAEDLLKDKSAKVLIYCRSGRRSALAAKVLSELGFTKVYDFGGILDWPYEIVTN